MIRFWLIIDGKTIEYGSQINRYINITQLNLEKMQGAQFHIQQEDKR